MVAAPAPLVAAFRDAQRVFMGRLADRSSVRFARSRAPAACGGAAPRDGSAVASPHPPLFGTNRQEAEIYERLRRSAVGSESASMVLCGHRGCGKHATLAAALDRLDADPAVPRYDVAELSGLVHAEAAAGLRELTAQLRADTGKGKCSRYVDDLGLVVDELRRRRAERRAPLLVVLSDLDAFALTPRQTLLYTLLDAMQSRLGCVVVVGVTTDHGVLELFEKRVRSRLSNHHVAFTRATAPDVEDLFRNRFALEGSDLFVAPGGAPSADDAAAYARAHGEARDALAVLPAFVDGTREAVAAGRSMRWFCRVFARAAAALDDARPTLDEAHLAEAFGAQEPNSVASWRKAVRALPAAEKALFVAFLKLERVGNPYSLEAASHVLCRLSQASASDAHDEGALLDAVASLADRNIVTLAAEARSRRDAHVLRFTPVRVAAAVDVEDLWLALRTDDLETPTSLRQWALNHL